MIFSIKIKYIKLLLISAIQISTLVNADQYNFYFPLSAESDDDGIPLEAMTRRVIF